MSYQEIKAIVSILSSIPILIFYGVYVHIKQQAGSIDLGNDLAFWAGLMLITIGVGIGITILIQIIFHIINTIITKREEDPTFEDELDKLIELKTDRFSMIVFGLGFVGSLVTLVMKMSPAVMLNILFFSCYVGSIMGEIGKLYYYRQGISNG
jgi:hypothetical protein